MEKNGMYGKKKKDMTGDERSLDHPATTVQMPSAAKAP